MTTPKKPATKKAATRRPRITAAEVRRREETQNARENIAMMSVGELAMNVRDIALRVRDIFEYELLMAVAARLEDPTAVAPKMVGPYAGGPYVPRGWQKVASGPAAPMIFNSPTADSVDRDRDNDEREATGVGE